LHVLQSTAIFVHTITTLHWWLHWWLPQAL